MAKLNGKETQIIQTHKPAYGMMSKEAYMEKGRAAARRKERLMWVSTPRSWQEKALKAGYEAEKEAIRLGHIAKHKEAKEATQQEDFDRGMAQSSKAGPVEVNAKGNPMRKRTAAGKRVTKEQVEGDVLRVVVSGTKAKVTALPDRLKHKTTRTKVTKDKDPGVTAKEVADITEESPATTLPEARNQVRNLQERMNGIKGTLNAQRSINEGMSNRLDRLNNKLDERSLELSRMERQKAWAHKKEEEATDNLRKTLQEVATTYGILGGMEVFLTSLANNYIRKDNGPKVYQVNELEMHTLRSLLGSMVVMLRPLHPEIARMQGEYDAAAEAKASTKRDVTRRSGPEFLGAYVFKEGDEVRWFGRGKDLYEGIVRQIMTDGKAAIYGRMIRGIDGLVIRDSQCMVYAVSKEDLRLRKKATLPSHFKRGDAVRFTQEGPNDELISYKGIVESIAADGDLKVLGKRYDHEGHPKEQFLVHPSRAVRVEGEDPPIRARVPSDFGKGDRVKFEHYMGNDGTIIVTGTVEDPTHYAHHGRVCVRVDKLLPHSTSPLQTVMAKDLELLDAAEEFVETPLTT